MTTAVLDLKAQSISPSALRELLGVEAPDYALGAYVREALIQLSHVRSFYALPAWLEPDLEGFDYHLREALKALQHARDRSSGMAGE